MSYDFSNKDLYAKIYIPLLHDKNRYNVIYGGRNSAKSHFIAQDIIMNLLDDEFFRFILLRKYRASIKDSQWQTIVDLIRLYELQEEFHITTSPLEIVCLRNHNKVLSRGLDKDSN
ncbi:MAG: phage terminase large subunit, partial [Candidatus Kapabacteria bacterium]|nr:phage terminase large subunit [Candidatus Kapabacteria bacterium]